MGIDLAALYYCASKKEYFSPYKAENFSGVKMSNNDVADIVGITNIRIQTNVACTIIIKNVGQITNLHSYT